MVCFEFAIFFGSPLLFVFLFSFWRVFCFLAVGMDDQRDQHKFCDIRNVRKHHRHESKIALDAVYGASVEEDQEEQVPFFPFPFLFLLFLTFLLS